VPTASQFMPRKLSVLGAIRKASRPIRLIRNSNRLSSCNRAVVLVAEADSAVLAEAVPEEAAQAETGNRIP